MAHSFSFDPIEGLFPTTLAVARTLLIHSFMASPSVRRRSRIAGFKAPFLVSVAGPAVIGLACGGQTEGGPEVPRLPDNPPACTDEPCAPGTVCPAEVPASGTSCEAYATGLTCDGPYCYGTEPLVRCGVDGLWERLEVPTCNPPPPERPSAPCSADIPVPGSDCAYPDQECFYPGCQGPESSWARCSFGQWLVDYSSGPACNPPAVVPVCPELEPSAGAGCAYLDQDCAYGTCDGGPGSAARGYNCGQFGWELIDNLCTVLGGNAAVDAGAAPTPGLP